MKYVFNLWYNIIITKTVLLVWTCEAETLFKTRKLSGDVYVCVARLLCSQTSFNSD